MNWLVTLIIYYLLGYVLAGGILVTWFGLLDWEHMTGAFVGMLIGHYLGRSDRMLPNG